MSAIIRLAITQSNPGAPPKGRDSAREGSLWFAFIFASFKALRAHDRAEAAREVGV